MSPITSLRPVPAAGAAPWGSAEAAAGLGASRLDFTMEGRRGAAGASSLVGTGSGGRARGTATATVLVASLATTGALEALNSGAGCGPDCRNNALHEDRDRPGDAHREGGRIPHAPTDIAQERKRRAQPPAGPIVTALLPPLAGVSAVTHFSSPQCPLERPLARH